MMNLLVSLFGRRIGGNRFNRYYGGVVGAGVGYPTADEARRDLRAQDLSFASLGFIR